MALLWLDSFDGYGSTGAVTPTGALSRKYSTAGQITFTIVAGRDGGYAIRIPYGLNTNRYFLTPPLTTDDTLIVSFAFKKSIHMQHRHRLIQLFTGSAEGMNITYEPGGGLAVWRDTSFLAATSDILIREGAWHYLQFKVVCDNAPNGSYELKLGDTTVLSETGIDTRVGGAYHDRVMFGVGYQNGTNYDYYVDDFSVCDSTGSENNDFLGNTKVVMINPNGDDTANWGIVQPGPNHFEAVNDATEADDDTSYVEETTTNVTDLYDYEALPTLGDIKGIQINTDCRESDVQGHSLITPVESNSTQYDDSSQSVGSTDYVTLVRVVETDPDTGNYWAEAGINAAKFGIKIG